MIYLALVEDVLLDNIVKGFRADCALVDSILTPEKPVLKDELAEREANHELLPWEKRPIQEACKTL